MSLDFEDQDPIDGTSSDVELGYWQGKLPATGAYFVTIQTVPGVSESSYSLDLRLEDPEAQEEEISAPEPIADLPADPAPSVTTEPVFNDRDNDPVASSQDVDVPQGTSRTILGNISAGETKEYGFNLAAGSTLVVMLTEGDALVEVYDPDGGFVWPTIPGSNQQQINNTSAGQYTVRVYADRNTDFRINVGIK
jgi:hypothetical protein